MTGRSSAGPVERVVRKVEKCMTSNSLMRGKVLIDEPGDGIDQVAGWVPPHLSVMCWAASSSRSRQWRSRDEETLPENPFRVSERAPWPAGPNTGACSEV